MFIKRYSAEHIPDKQNVKYFYYEFPNEYFCLSKNGNKMSLRELRTALKNSASKKQAEIAQWFFKTGPGEYGEGDVFIGIKVPVLRSIAKQHLEFSLDDLQILLQSKIHEERLVSLMIMVQRFSKCSPEDKKILFDLYLDNTSNINNWDLVDLSAPQIVGGYLIDKDKKILTKLASSKLLWERRIAMMATFQFIKSNRFETSLHIAEKLLNDKHDLIHKAAGWMLREIGKRNLETEEHFLKKHYKTMPRTMLRYAIEKFPEKKRKAYLQNKI